MAGVAPQKSGPVPQELELPGGKSGFRNWLDRNAWRDIIIAVPYIWLILFFVVPFAGDTTAGLIRALGPDVLVKGADWPLARIVGRRDVRAHGGVVRRIPLQSGCSTSCIIRRILSRHRPR